MSDQTIEQYFRYCPGEERIRISDAVCFGRRRRNFPKCPGCPFNDDEKVRPAHQRILAPGLIIQEVAEPMIDKVFKAYDIRGEYPDPLNEDLAWRIGFSTATFLRAGLSGIDRSRREMNRVVVGRDMRLSSPPLSSALIDGIRSSGTDVVDIGQIDTSQLYFAVNHLKCCGGIQTTASHNPAQYNGFKICGLGGKPIGSDTGLNEIKLSAKNTARHEAEQKGNIEQTDLSEPYRRFVQEFLKPLRKLTVVVDASNGMAGRWLPILFGAIPELKIDPMNFEHAGVFVHDPNPLVPANIQPTRDRVRKTGADLGVAFDGDADRCMLVDEKGEVIPCDLLTAMLAEYFLLQHPGATVVYDLRSSRIVSETVQRLGGRPMRSRVGHAFMKKTLADAKAVFGGELSGHFYFKDNWYCDSAMVAFVHVLNILSQSSKPLSDWIAPYRKYHSSGERNFINNQADVTIRHLAEMHPSAKVDYLDGITVQYPDWWFNVRKSNTEPLLRLNLEANTAELLETQLAALSRELGQPTDH